jgi:hypothetical protein
MTAARRMRGLMIVAHASALRRAEEPPGHGAVFGLQGDES